MAEVVDDLLFFGPLLDWGIIEFWMKVSIRMMVACSMSICWLSSSSRDCEFSWEMELTIRLSSSSCSGFKRGWVLSIEYKISADQQLYTLLWELLQLTKIPIFYAVHSQVVSQSRFCPRFDDGYIFKIWMLKWWKFTGGQKYFVDSWYIFWSFCHCSSQGAYT